MQEGYHSVGSSINNSSADMPLISEVQPKLGMGGLTTPLLMKPSPLPRLKAPPPKNDTILMAILCTQHLLGPQATVRECLEKYLDIKMREVDDIAGTINFAFMSRLQAMEDQLIGESVPVNSEAEPQKKS